jgi:hypothetical protein
MLARSATAGQATFEPDEDEEDEEDEEEEEEEEEEEDEEPDDEPLPTVSPDFLSLLPDLSPDESAPEAPSDFLVSEPFGEALAASEAFCAARLSVR